MSELYVGMMTGTSLDGLDAVLVDFSARPPRLLASHSCAYPAHLKSQMLALQAGSDGTGLNELHRSRVAAIALSELHSQAFSALLAHTAYQPSQIAAIGVHGQTVRHAPALDTPYTVQLIDASRIAQATGCAVVSDFRARDIAAGGQGAPLVPAYHAALCASLPKPVALVNIGGFANVSLLHADGAIQGFDTGPGNVLMDAWTAQHTGKPYDALGAWAASGQCDDALLSRLLSHPYFHQALPKSTGREAFDLAWLSRCMDNRSLAPANVQATLAALTAHTIAQAIVQYSPSCQGLYVCGGGAYNTHLMALIQGAVTCAVHSTAALGVAPQHMEAMAFAWLARQCLMRLPGNVPSVTGASRALVLGTISPA
jgi:anhydro-N-acetylmuramic acid kinase